MIECALASVSMEVSNEKDIYVPFHTTKSIQYLLNQGFVRVENDAALTIGGRNALQKFGCDYLNIEYQ